jgi:hypothetical protein
VKEAQLLVYSHKTTPRLQYIFKLLLSDIIGVEFNITNNKSEFQDSKLPKLTYCEHAFGDELFIFATRLLFEKGIVDQEVNVFDWKNMPVFFGTHPKYDIPFDLFSASFYLVSRYEEYLPHIKDEHLRFSPQQSLAYQKGFLNKPLINIWCQELKQQLKAKYPDLLFKEKQYKFISTFDIDSAYAYQEKGITRQFGAFSSALLKLDFDKIIERIKVLAGFHKDPYDTYDWQLDLKEKYHLKQIYFFLLGNYGEFDKNISVEGSIKFQSLIKSIADNAEVGIHPSYASNGDKNQIQKEIKRLSKVVKREITKSRQHFLKLTFPETFRNLIEMDVQEDYSLGYASETGFRASICSPFYFYDLDLDTTTQLKLTPFMLMDGTLKDYLGLTPEEAINRSKLIIDEVKNVNGVFVSLWHNHTINDKDDWAGWKKVYEEIVAYASCK